MGLILWIDQNTFASALLEKVFKSKGLPFYTLATASDFAYLVDDLAPQAIVLDAATARESLEAFRTQYQTHQSLQKIAYIFIGETEGLDFVKNNIGSLKRTFDPFKIPDEVKHLLDKV